MVLENCPFDKVARDHTDLVCGLNVEFVGGVADGPRLHRPLGQPGAVTRPVLRQRPSCGRSAGTPGQAATATG